MKIPLPIDPLLPDVQRALEQPGVVLLAAPPGSGKTTRVPAALLDLDLRGDVVVLEPRRLAARAAAARVASELGTEVGELVGYQVRGDRVAGARTRLCFLTEGVLVRRLVQDAFLDGTAVVVLDESTVLMSADAPRTAELFRERGLEVVTTPVTEFEKLEGCVTCLSVRVRD